MEVLVTAEKGFSQRCSHLTPVKPLWGIVSMIIPILRKEKMAVQSNVIIEQGHRASPN